MDNSPGKECEPVIVFESLIGSVCNPMSRYVLILWYFEQGKEMLG